LRSVPERCSVCLQEFEKGQKIVVSKKAIIQRAPVRKDGLIAYGPLVYYDSGKIKEAVHEECPVVC
jgi:hypothetical protein